MNFKIISCLCFTTVLQLSCFNNFVNGQTDWVWGQNRITGQNGPNSPQSGNNNNNNNGGQSGSGLVPANTVNIFGSGGNSNFGSSNSGSGFGNGGDRDFPILPSQQQQQQATVVQVLQPGSTTGGSNSNAGSGGGSTNGALPSNSIRAVEGEPRLFTRQIRRFVQNAVNNLSGNGNANNANSATSSNNLIPGTLLGALLALGPAFIGNRYPNLPSTGNGGSSSGSSFKPNRPTNRPNRPNTSSSSNGGRVCACVSDDQCRLPSIVMGSCGGGVMCCKSSGVRIIGDDNRSDNGRDRDRDRDSSASNSRVQAAEIRAGLFGEIVRGTSNVIDDALDLILAPFLTQDDQQKLASRLGTNSASRKN